MLKLFQALLTPIVARLFPRFLKTFGAINGAIIPDEFAKAIKAGLASATVCGGLALALQSLAASAPAIFPNSITAAVVGFVLVHLAALVVLMGQGKPKPPSPSPSPSPAPSPPAPLPPVPSPIRPNGTPPQGPGPDFISGHGGVRFSSN